MHVQKVSGIGGSERHLLALLPALAARGIEVRLLAFIEGEFRRLVDPLGAQGIDILVIHAGPDINPALVPRMLRAIRSFRPDVIHTHLIHADIYGQLAARILRVPSISSVHGTLRLYRRQPYRSAAWVGGHLAHRTIAISEHVRRFIDELGLASVDRVRVVPYGIDPSGWLLSPEERERGRADFGVGPGVVVVGVASRMFPNKGHDVLLRAIAKALPSAPDLRLLVAGEGPLRPELERYARQHLPEGTSRFLGYVSDMRLFMNVCDLLVFPSLPGFGEGFGLAALEAMGAARPVVASGIDSLPEVVEHERTGFLVEPGAVDELAERLVILAKDSVLRSALGARGRDRACSVFTLEAMVEKTLAVYEEVVGPSGLS